jgi:hypothetical protein
MEAGRFCRMTEKVECNKFLAYLWKLNSMKEQRVLIKELRYLITEKAPRLSSGQGGK